MLEKEIMGNSGTDFTRCLLIAGLGNPGTEYSGTRHNIGFMVVDKLLTRLPKNFEVVHGCSSHYWRGTYAGKPLLLQKPETYMNLSGDAISALMRKNGIRPEEILVVYDDMDLELGRMRIRKNGSSGGHNGIKSIIEMTGTESFPRLRVGIGHGAGGRGGKDFVLSGFDQDETPVCEKVIEAAADALIMILRRGCTAAMNHYNSQDYSKELSGESDGTIRSIETIEKKHQEV